MNIWKRSLERVTLGASVAALLFTLAGLAPTANAAGGPTLGTPAAAQNTAPRAASPMSATTGPLTSVYTVTQSGGYVAGGAAMRNYGAGDITISGIPSGSKVTFASLTWDVLGNSLTSAMAQGSINGNAITGHDPITGGDPCWGNTNNFAFASTVTPYVSGNGVYHLTGFASGLTNGTDPWTSSPPPMLEGASLIVEYYNPSMPLSTITYLRGAAMTTGGVLDQTLAGNYHLHTKTTFIVSDGQYTGPSSTKGAYVNGTNVGPLNGSDPFPGPNGSKGNLHDTLTVDVSNVVPKDSTSMDLQINGGNADCLVWNGQMVSTNK